MNKLSKFLPATLIIIASFFVFLGASVFSPSRYVDMAVDQKILITLDTISDFLIAIFFVLMALYFKKE